MKKIDKQCPQCNEEMNVVAVLHPDKAVMTKILYCKSCKTRVSVRTSE